jgi:hypothetical protein
MGIDGSGKRLAAVPVSELQNSTRHTKTKSVYHDGETEEDIPQKC